MPSPSWIPACLRTRRSRLFLLPLLIFLFVYGCQSFRSPGIRMVENPPVFTDDADRDSLIRAAGHQLHSLDRRPADSVVDIGGTAVTAGRLADSLRLFLSIVNSRPTPAELAKIIEEKFTVYQAAGRRDSPFGEMLITGYYQPVFAGSLSKVPPFLYPLYTRPGSLIVLNNPHGGRPLIGRRDTAGHLLPFWTRAEIENRHILAGNELVYLEDPVDVFFLQVQGSGLIRLQDGSLRPVHISATNGREYNSIGKLLVDEHKVAKKDISMQTIRRYLHDHPAEIRQILQHNDRFVFFRWASGEPRGSMAEELTPGRSLAIDPESLPMGTVAYMISRRPIVAATGEVIGWMPLRRFVFPQDTGAAIRGPGRADIFWGSGRYAETAAGCMKESGRLYFLVKKHRQP